MKYRIGLVCSAELADTILRCPDCEIVFNVESGVDAVSMQERMRADIIIRAFDAKIGRLFAD